MHTIMYHPPSGDHGSGYYTLNFGKKWFQKRKARNKQQRKSRKANRR